MVYCCAISKNGLFVISGSGDRLLKKWNTQTGALDHDFVGHEQAVRCCDISNK